MPTSLSFKGEATPWKIRSIVKVYGKPYCVSQRNYDIVEAAWRARRRRLTLEELIIQLLHLLRVSGYQAIARLFRTSRHSRVLQRVIDEHVIACNLERLPVFRQLVIDYEEILGK